MNEKNNTDPLSRDLKRELDAMSFSESAKARMTNNIEQAVASQQRREGVQTPGRQRAQKRSVPLRFAVAVAAVVAMFGMGTFAYASGALVSVQDAIAEVFGNGPAPTEVVDKIGHPIGAAQSKNGVTVSADAVIADGHNYAIVYSIAKDDGTPFEGLEANEYGYLNVINEGQFTDISGLYNIFDADRTQGAYGSSYFYDADPSDNAIQMVEQMSCQSGSNNLVGRTAHVTFGNFRVVEDSYEEAPMLAAGEWNLSFKMDCEDSSVALNAGKPFATQSGNAVMEEMIVSPIAVTLNYAFDEGEVDPQAVGDRTSEEHGAGDVINLLDDGTQIVVANNGGMTMGWSDDGSLTCSQSLFLPQIIDPAHVVSVSVGGTEFTLD